MQGRVAARPRLNDFAMEFPLAISAVGTGRDWTDKITGNVWVEAPRNLKVEQGDTILIGADLADLQRAGNPGERSRRATFILRSCWARARVGDASDVKVLHKVVSTTLARRIEDWRSGLRNHYEDSFLNFKATRIYARSSAELLTAMVYGEGSLAEPPPRQIREAFRSAGMLHLLVASGTQVALLTGLLLVGLRSIGLRGMPLLLILVPILLFYALLSGGGASIWRATVVGICLCIALLSGRETDGLSLWSFAFVILLLLDPLQIHDIGFQLSFAAAWGLIVVAPAMQRLLDGRLAASPLSSIALLTISAQITTIPLILYHFGSLSTAALFSNVLAVPLAGILVGTGMLGLLVPFVNIINYALIHMIQSIAFFAAAIPASSAQTTALSMNHTVAVYAALLLVLFASLDTSALAKNVNAIALDESRKLFQHLPSRGHWRIWAATSMIGIALFIGLRWRPTYDRALHVAFLDVGQGESILIQGPERTVLIDGGSVADEGRGEVGRAVIVPYLLSRGIRKLDAVIVTHADADHCNGLRTVLREVEVGHFIDGAATSLRNSTPESLVAAVDYQEVKQEAKIRHIPRTLPAAGQRINLGDGAVITLLTPSSTPFRGENNNATVIRLDHRKISMLFTADIEAEAEARLMQNSNLSCTLLKVAHHGSKTSTSEAFLRAARPTFAVLSCGRYNSFGHPSPTVLARLSRRGVPVFRTDRQGAVEVASNGENCIVQTMR
jgi:competence protein ComEC